MNSISSALAANGLWYALVGLFLLFSPSAVASPLSLAVPSNDFYVVLGGAGTIGLGVVLFGLSRNFTPAAVNATMLANVIVLLTMLYQLLVAKYSAPGNTGTIVLWVLFIILVAITLAEATMLNQRRRR